MKGGGTMATIKTVIQIQDNLSRQFHAMNQAMSTVIDSFQRLEQSTSHAIDISALRHAQQQLTQVDASFNGIEQEIRQADQAQQNLNNHIRNGTSAADGLLSKLGAVAATYLGIHTAGNIIKLSDEMTNTTARLNLLLDENSTQQELDNLQQMIFDSAQRSYSSYLDTSAAVSKLGILAGKAFSGNDEIIAFTELMNKNFAIGGQGIQEQTAAMYQLTQAMAAGKLQGDEFRSITENAPLLAQAIEEQMRKIDPGGSMKEWSAEGMLTADVIKTAMFSAADEINRKFESMPLTYAQIWTNFKNNALLAFQPVLEKLNEIANNDKFQNTVNAVTNSLFSLSNVALSVLSVIMGIGGFIYDNWSFIGPVILGSVVALGYLTTALTISKAAILMKTAAIWFMNSALLASPIFWIPAIIIAIVVVIYLAIAALNKFAGTSISATGVIAGVFMVALAFIGNLFVGLWNLIVDISASIWNIFATVAEFLANVFVDPLGSIVRLFAGMADAVLGILEGIASAIDAVFGSNLASVVNGWRSGLSGKVTDLVGEAKIKMERMDNSKLKLDRFEYGKAWDTGYKWGSSISNKMPKMDENLGKASAFDYSGAVDALDKLGGSGKDTAANTAKMADSMDMAEEDLKYLRDLAERESINRYTTGEIKIDMKNDNYINNEMDIDGIIDRFAEKLEEAVEVVAEGGVTDV